MRIYGGVITEAAAAETLTPAQVKAAMAGLDGPTLEGMKAWAADPLNQGKTEEDLAAAFPVLSGVANVKIRRFVLRIVASLSGGLVVE